MTTQIVPVSLMPNKFQDDIETGKHQPTLILTETPSTTQVVIDSSDRISGNASNFFVNMGYSLSKCRYLQLKRVLIPKINNINPVNRSISIKTPDVGVLTFNLPVGLYNTSSFSNMITSTLNTEFNNAGSALNVVCSFDSLKRTFSIQDVGGFFFFIVDTCDFIKYGETMVPFESEPVANAPSKSIIYSSTSGMLYTTYLSVSSSALTQFSYANSITSNSKEPSSIIGIIDLCEIYTSQDFDIVSPYNGLYRSLEVDGNKVSVMNSSRSMPVQIDINIFDGYGLPVENILSLGSPYPSEKIGIVLIFEASF